MIKIELVAIINKKGIYIICREMLGGDWVVVGKWQYESIQDWSQILFHFKRRRMTRTPRIDGTKKRLTTVEAALYSGVK